MADLTTSKGQEASIERILGKVSRFRCWAACKFKEKYTWIPNRMFYVALYLCLFLKLYLLGSRKKMEHPRCALDLDWKIQPAELQVRYFAYCSIHSLCCFPRTWLLQYRNVFSTMSPDLVLVVRGQKIGGGGRVMERRKRDVAKYEAKQALIGCSIMHEKAPRACLFLSLAVPKTCQRSFIELKKN